MYPLYKDLEVKPDWLVRPNQWKVFANLYCSTFKSTLSCLLCYITFDDSSPSHAIATKTLKISQQLDDGNDGLTINIAQVL